MIPTLAANGSPAFGQYKPAEGGGFEPWALQVVEIEDGRIEELTFFLETETLFPLFGLPPRLDAVVRYDGSTAVRPMNATSSRSSSEAFCRRTVQPCRRAPSWRLRERVDGDGIGLDPADVAEGDVGRARSRSAQTRPQSPGGRHDRSDRRRRT